MFRNYLKIIWRNLLKDKVFTSLNLFGLSVAFGAVILLSTYSLFELSFNRFHENIGSIYQIYATQQRPKGPEAGTSQPVPLAEALKEEVPGIAKITRYTGNKDLVIREGKQLDVVSAYVDPDFLSIFSFPIIRGEKEDPITERSQVALTQQAAEKIFGTQDIIGESIHIHQEGEEVPFVVSAIIEDLPEQSSINFEMLINFKNLPDFVYADNLDSWDKSNHEVFLQLSEGATPTAFEAATRPFTDHHFQEQISDAKRDGAQADENGAYMQMRLIPFQNVTFTKFENGRAEVKKTIPFLVLGIALLILFIASINFINLSIARSSQRLREIGMRKTLGASRSQLFFQFWGESLIVFLMAIIIGGLIAGNLMGPFRTLFRTQASWDTISNPAIILIFIKIFFAVTLIAGGYPALLLSKLKTLQALKGSISIGGSNKLRNSLIVLQFGIAILLISGTLVLWNQLEFLKTKDLGFNKEQVITFPLNGKHSDARVMQLLRNELQENSNILNISAASSNLGLGKDGSRSTSVLGFDHEGRGVTTNMLITDHEYIETLGLEMLEGRSFDRKYGTDSLAVVINEAMAAQFSTGSILNTRLVLDDSISYSVIGVFKNYHFQDLNRRIEPLTLFLDPNWNLNYAYVKVAPHDISASFDQVKQAWSRIEPQAQFLGSFLDENIDRTLRRERTMTTMITSGSIIAITLSCTGLFAISMLVVAQRRKEIGIRKVVGASVLRITMILTLDFLKLIGLSFVVAAPLAWWLSHEWIRNYAFRIDLNVWIFLSAGFIAVIIALLTVGFQSLKAATANPVKSLRSE